MRWFKKLSSGLSKTSTRLSEGIGSIFTKRKLDEEMLQELEELLIMADIGAGLAAALVSEFGKERFGKEISPKEVREALAELITERLSPYAGKVEPDFTQKPYVLMFVGVNGNGKTTTLGKMAKGYSNDGKRVSVAACDTFRAAAVEQLAIWAERADAEIISGALEADTASVAYAALEKAQQNQSDILLIDTAGRLQTKQGLMEELGKIRRVLQKRDENAPHATILVLDATTGQNAYSQVEAFSAVTPLSGLIITKLDGTAKGGVVIGLAERFKLPIVAIGVGEGVDDLQPFSAAEFSRSLLGLEGE